MDEYPKCPVRDKTNTEESPFFTSLHFHFMFTFVCVCVRVRVCDGVLVFVCVSIYYTIVLPWSMVVLCTACVMLQLKYPSSMTHYVTVQ